MVDKPLTFAQHMLLLKNAAPAPFDEFVAAFERYLGEMFTGIVRCPKEELDNYQGRIQQAVGLLHLFKTCDVEVKRPEPAPR